jgi:hypothetical protein
MPDYLIPCLAALFLGMFLGALVMALMCAAHSGDDDDR